MKVTINGKEINIEKGVTISELLKSLGIKSETVVVEKNLKILERSAYDREIVKENDKIEIIRFMGGGMKKFPESGIYSVITEKYCKNKSAVKTLKEVLRSGVKIVQLREKDYPKRKIYEMALDFRKLTRRYGALLIINDYVDIALACGADGVHLGQDDLSCVVARKLAPGLIIGISTHNLKEAMEAQKNGATYINIGPVFPTKTKEVTCPPVGIATVKEVAAAVKIPVTAMGGIKEENVGKVLSAGAKIIAMVTEITLSPDIGRKIRNLTSIINGYEKF